MSQPQQGISADAEVHFEAKFSQQLLPQFDHVAGYRSVPIKGQEYENQNVSYPNFKFKVIF